jgi:hypothetical protein
LLNRIIRQFGRFNRPPEQRFDRSHFKHVQIQYAGNFVKRMFQIQPLLHDCNRDVGRDCNPYLRLDGVLYVAVKSLDAKVLFDPFKKKFHLPSLFVKSASRDGRQCKVFGQKLERLASLYIDERYTPE